MVSAAEAGLEIAEDGVDPVEHRQVLGFARTDDGRLVGTAAIGDAGEAGQAVGDDGAGRGEVRTRPVGDGGAGEAGQSGELRAQRMALVVERDRADEGHLVLRTAPDRAAGQFAAEIGVVDLHGPAQHRGGLALEHRLHQRVMDQPGGRIADPEIAFQGQGRESGLGLADEINRQEPHGQSQLGGLEQGSGDQRGLMMADVALEGLAGAAAQHAVRGSAAVRAAKPVRPTRALQRRLALRLGAELLEVLEQRHPVLELDPIHGHGRLRRVVELRPVCARRWLIP